VIPDPNDLLTTAVKLHEENQIDAACSIYRQVLDSEPRHARALCYLGIAALQTGHAPQAVDFFRRSLASDSNHFDAWFHLGLALSNLSHFEQAAEAYRKAVAIAPEHARSYCMLGNVLTALGRVDEGSQSYERSLELNPNNAEAANNLGSIRKAQKKLDQAERLFLHALSLEPNHSDLHVLLFNLSQVYFDAGRSDLTLPILRQALTINPRADWYVQLVYALLATGDLAGAMDACRTALNLDPACSKAHYEIGNMLAREGRLEEAVACYEAAVRYRPNFVEALSNLGAANQRLGRMETALGWYQHVLQFDPSSPKALFNLGALQSALGKFDLATAYLRRAHEADPTNIETLGHLSVTLVKLHLYDEAARVAERRVELQPMEAGGHLSLGTIYSLQEHYDLALKCYRQAYDLAADAPGVLSALINQQNYVCEWENLDELSGKYLEYVDRVLPAPGDSTLSPFVVICLSKASSGKQQHDAARKRISTAESLIHSFVHRVTPATARRRARKKIRIGYLSGDLQDHPVGYLVAELFESHDRNAFQVFGYSFGPATSSPLRKRLVHSFDRFRDIHSASFEQAAAQIADDEIDILVDLHGHTTHSRTEIALMKPAPILVNYLGYPGTMGTSKYDYILVDEYIVPSEKQIDFAEKLVHLPGCFLVSDSKREIDPRTPLRHQVGLPEDAFVFCAFHNNLKMNRTMFEIWMRLLIAVPKSVIWFRDSNRFAVENLKKEAARFEIDESRLVMATRLPMPQHLARHRAADLFLDSFPYNQHSTAADSLRVGLPILTLSGETFASRVAGSLLTELGLPELITNSFEHYEARALQLATRPDELSAIRRKLNERLKSTDLFDGKAFARKLDAVYRTMWENYLASDSGRDATSS
jgi:predicted O-linked N-acetylglucosamine transferase (SPINDLY family)